MQHQSISYIGNYIGDEGAKAIATALKSNNTITSLDLGGNVIQSPSLHQSKNNKIVNLHRILLFFYPHLGNDISNEQAFDEVVRMREQKINTWQSGIITLLLGYNKDKGCTLSSLPVEMVVHIVSFVKKRIPKKLDVRC